MVRNFSGQFDFDLPNIISPRRGRYRSVISRSSAVLVTPESFNTSDLVKPVSIAVIKDFASMTRPIRLFNRKDGPKIFAATRLLKSVDLIFLSGLNRVVN